MLPMGRLLRPKSPRLPPNRAQIALPHAPQQYVKQWPFGLLSEVLGCYSTYFSGPSTGLEKIPVSLARLLMPGL